MGYNRPGKQDIRQQIKTRLRGMERMGESKHTAKKTGVHKQGMYSRNTCKEYNRECQKFADYVTEHSPEGRWTALDDALDLAKQYIASIDADASISPYTVAKRRSALAKLYQCEGKELGEIRGCTRQGIRRSRRRTIVSDKTGKTIKNPTSRAGHFSEKNHDEEVRFAKSTGLRRSEMEQVRGDQIREKDGTYYIDLEGWQCKGGRPRTLRVIGDVDLVRDMCAKAGKSKVFGHVSSAMDTHYYRGLYGSALYDMLARDPATIPRKERYCCRGELKGTWYDRKAMFVVSQCLGHNRVSVIAGHYLYSLKGDG